ncbi:hypothetical protein CGMCC3_g11460 [Colletotrichum fructicola]|nr:uncharacterized protein CGMCC3_g11460 [Colletotrichum fructicola]KAE9572453.1 hypothetical protein CGMCC3_g11460 [Colletotrichum fructicola]
MSFRKFSTNASEAFVRADGTGLDPTIGVVAGEEPVNMANGGSDFIITTVCIIARYIMTVVERVQGLIGEEHV